MRRRQPAAPTRSCRCTSLLTCRGPSSPLSFAASQSPIPVEVVDSRSLGMAMGYAVLSAARAAQQGQDAKTVAAIASSRAEAATVIFYVDTLEHLRRGGRIGAASALLGSALAIKPLLALSDGCIKPIEKVRTSVRALSRLEELAMRAVEAASGPGVDIAVHHLDSQTRASRAGRPVADEGAVHGHGGSGRARSGGGRTRRPGHDRGRHLAATIRRPGLTMTGSWLVVWVAVVLGFFVGAVSPATIIAKARHVDLRQGSGNPGATNAGRVLGVRWGVAVGLLDVLKGLVPTLLALWLGDRLTAYAVGLACVLGHVLSPFLRGRGGKGVATSMGAVLAVFPWFALGMSPGVRADAVAHAVGGWLLPRGRGSARAVCRLGAAAGAGRRWQGVGDRHRRARHRPPPWQHPPMGSPPSGLKQVRSALLGSSAAAQPATERMT